MALTFQGSLPEGALVRTHRTAAGNPAPIWLTAADPGPAGGDPAPIRHWQARGSGHAAVAVEANAAGTVMSAQGLRFTPDANSGLVLSGAVPDIASVSFAVVFHAGTGSAKTLLTLRAPGADGYVFLSAEGDAVRLAQKGGDLALTADAGGAGPLLVICALTAGQARLCVGAGPVLSASMAGRAGGAGDLFIGCRGQRAGLRNKLGSFTLSDVMVWPGHDVLALPGDPAVMAAMQIWTERQRLGL